MPTILAPPPPSARTHTHGGNAYKDIHARTTHRGNRRKAKTALRKEYGIIKSFVKKIVRLLLSFSNSSIYISDIYIRNQVVLG